MKVNYGIIGAAVLLLASGLTIYYRKTSVTTFSVSELIEKKPVGRVEVSGMFPVGSLKFTKKTSKVVFPIGDSVLAPPNSRVTVTYFGDFPQQLRHGCKVKARGIFSPTFSDFAADTLESECEP